MLDQNCMSGEIAMRSIWTDEEESSSSSSYAIMAGSEQAGGRDRQLISPAPQPQPHPLINYHTNAFSFNYVYRPCNTSTTKNCRSLPSTSTQILTTLLPNDGASVEQDTSLDDVCGIQDPWEKIALSPPETCSKLQRFPIDENERAMTSIDDTASPQNPRKVPDANSLRHEFQVPHGLAALEFRFWCFISKNYQPDVGLSERLKKIFDLALL